MIFDDLTLFAIYKNGEHKGNEKGVDEKNAIKNYIIASQFKSFLKDKDFVNQYSAVIALEKTHYVKSTE